MTSRAQWMVVAGVVAVLGTGMFVAVRALGPELFPVTVGSRAPDFTAKMLGTPATKSLTDYKGQVVLLNIWATWCMPCRVEMPSIEELHRTYGPMGLRVIAVSVDDAVPEDSIAAYARDLGLSFEILHDSLGTIEKSYQATGYPETFVIGRDGRIRKKWIGATNWNSLSNRVLVAQLLGLSSPTPVSADSLQLDTAGSTPRASIDAPPSPDGAAVLH